MRNDYKFDDKSREYYREKQRRRRERLQDLPKDYGKEDRLMVEDAFEGVCGYCGAFPEDVPFEHDHFIDAYNDDCPGTVVGNMVYSCRPCNRSKGKQDPKDWLSPERYEYVRKLLVDMGAYWL